jgi:hypothetical protein
MTTTVDLVQSIAIAVIFVYILLQVYINKEVMDVIKSNARYLLQHVSNELKEKGDKS